MHVIDSDCALCFYLVSYYHTRANKLKRVVMAVAIYSIWIVSFFVIVPHLNPNFRPISFLGQVITSLILMGISIATSLRAPKFKVDYRAHQKKKHLYEDMRIPTRLSELRSLSSAANAKVEAEGERAAEGMQPPHRA